MPAVRAVGIGIDKDKEQTAREVCEALGAEYVSAPEYCGGAQIGSLAGLPGYPGAKTGELSEKEMLIFSGFSRELLEKAVDELRARGCVIPLKAVVTKHNAGWTVNELAGELAAEHEAMSQMQRKREGS